MSELYPPEEEEEPPLWFSMLPEPMQYLLMVRMIMKVIQDPETPAKIRAASDAMEQSMRILQGREQ